MSPSVQVNFGRLFPVFPLPDTVLLPHAVQVLHVTEPRYRSLIDHALDSSGQFALATWVLDENESEQNIQRAIRDAVCLVQVIHHEEVHGGYEVMLHGICRAGITELIQGTDEHAWCEAKLRPLEQLGDDQPIMQGVRDELYAILTGNHLKALNRVQTVVDWFEREDVSTHTLLELIGFTFVHDREIRYQLLAEPSFDGRTRIIRTELGHLDRLIGLARRQLRDDQERGMSLN